MGAVGQVTIKSPIPLAWSVGFIAVMSLSAWRYVIHAWRIVSEGKGKSETIKKSVATRRLARSRRKCLNNLGSIIVHLSSSWTTDIVPLACFSSLIASGCKGGNIYTYVAPGIRSKSSPLYAITSTISTVSSSYPIHKRISASAIV